MKYSLQAVLSYSLLVFQYYKKEKPWRMAVSCEVYCFKIALQKLYEKKCLNVLYESCSYVWCSFTLRGNIHVDFFSCLGKLKACFHWVTFTIFMTAFFSDSSKYTAGYNSGEQKMVWSDLLNTAQGNHLWYLCEGECIVNERLCKKESS